MISFGSCIYPTLGSVKVSPSRVASPENYKHQKVSGVTPNYLVSRFQCLHIQGNFPRSRENSMVLRSREGSSKYRQI